MAFMTYLEQTFLANLNCFKTFSNVSYIIAWKWAYKRYIRARFWDFNFSWEISEPTPRND